MHSGGSSGAVKKARVEIIPLIDVIMFLLATFVLFTLSMNKSEGESSVSLKEAQTGQDREVGTNNVTISITTEGKIFWNKENVSWDDFLIRLLDYRQRTPKEDRKMFVNFDQGARFGQAMSALNEIRKAEITKIMIETKVKPATR
jgi:biopolymer transport protein ExbD